MSLYDESINNALLEMIFKEFQDYIDNIKKDEVSRHYSNASKWP